MQRTALCEKIFFTLLQEKCLLGNPGAGGLCYKPENLNEIHDLLVPYGNLENKGFQAGETIITALLRAHLMEQRFGLL